MKLLQIANRILEKRSRNEILILTLFLALSIGAVEGLTGADVLILYVLPVYVAAWYGGVRVGNVIAIYSTGAWLFSALANAGLLRGHGAITLALLSALVARLLVYMVISIVVARLKQTMVQQNEMARFIVHDLRSPISSSITGLLTLQQAGHELPEEDVEMINLALVSNQRALSLVNSILDVSKLSEGKMPVTASECDLHGMAKGCLDQVALWAKANEVELISLVEVDKWLLDESLTSRVIVNLLSNALKFSPTGSQVTLKISLGSHGMLAFSVADQGKGIPADYADRIFDPFVQVKGTQGGTGLGLTFCRLAVGAQGGRIWVDSTVGKGTKMRFTLPQGVKTRKGNNTPER